MISRSGNISAHELIDTLWNVNTISSAVSPKYALELIDTLWNVNTQIVCRMECVGQELIDTLWNVNLPQRMPLS